MSDKIINDVELKKAKALVRELYEEVRAVRAMQGDKPKAEEAADSKAQFIMDQIKGTKLAIKAYQESRPPSQFMEVKHRHLLSEADRMVQKFAHLLEESLDRKIMKVEGMASAIPGDPYAPGADPMKAALLNEARVLKMVQRSVVQARDQFTADAVEHHTRLLKERLELGQRPRRKRPK